MAPRPGLRQARRRRGFNQEQFAERVGVTAQTVGYWERGVTGVNAGRRPAMAAALEISLSELDRLIEGEPFDSDDGLDTAGGNPGTTWTVEPGRLPRRNYQCIPPPAADPVLAPGDDGFELARRNLQQIASAIRITPGRHAGNNETGVEVTITCGALGELLTSLGA